MASVTETGTQQPKKQTVCLHAGSIKNICVALSDSTKKSTLRRHTKESSHEQEREGRRGTATFSRNSERLFHNKYLRRIW